MSIDYSLEDVDGFVRVHRADCPTVRELVDRGVTVVTMFDCQVALDEEEDVLIFHSCLKE